VPLRVPVYYLHSRSDTLVGSDVSCDAIVFVAFYTTLHRLPVAGIGCNMPTARVIPSLQEQPFIHQCGGSRGSMADRWANPSERGTITQRVSSPSQTTMLRCLTRSLRYYNDTYLWNQASNFCTKGTNLAKCITYRGGLYDPSRSESKKVTAILTPHIFDDTVANWTRDDIKLQDNTSLSQFEFALRTTFNNPFIEKGELGLGRASTFLDLLSATERISSKAYSFFWGNEVTNEPREGVLTLGGFDAAILGDSPNIIVPVTKDEPSCKEGLIVTLTSLGLEISGSVRDVWDGLPDLRVCVIPEVSNIMSIPVAYWDPIEAAMGVERTSSRNGTSSEYFWSKLAHYLRIGRPLTSHFVL
jgi:hypothetical protein